MLRKLFGGIKMTWGRLIAFAVASGVITGLIALLVLALIVAWAGYSGYVKHMDNKPHKTAEVDYTAITDYASDMSAQGSEEAEDADEEKSEDQTAETDTSEGEAAEGEAEQPDENSGE